ncbi:hypothetical protein RHSIM_RhsimUnG0219300 [Rhododendron simsii]|uniref:RRM domain-containing protein n=1 Tax=Rhododendron simsii TaxID=118357 RepID=A0A834FTX4_RHOSS|nr:hypothetical protein RHSIM_RhsimUnG0219300 [Rhododendron simsii]
MAKKNKTTKQQQKLTKKQPPQPATKIDKKKKKTTPKKKKLPKKQTPYDSDSDSDSLDADDSDDIQSLLEPYTKDQLIDLVISAALDDPELLARIHAAANADVTHRKIFVFGLGWDTTREALALAFQPHGDIDECNVITDRNTGKAKGYGFVLFKTRQGAIRALKEPKKVVGNKTASCQLASAGPAPGAGAGHDAGGRKIYVSGVPAEAGAEKLKMFFAKFGEIEEGPIGFDTHTGKSRGFALFVYKTLEGAKKALSEPYKLFDGSQLQCQKAADGKNKAVAAAPAPPVLAAAPQNVALFGQNPYLNPSFNPNLGLGLGLFSQNPSFNPSLGLYGQYPSLAMGMGGYGGIGSSGAMQMGNFGGGQQSVLGAYGSAGPMQMGMQYAYPSSQIGQASSVLPAKTPGAGGSFSRYPS